jgi:hypothetical protein
LHIAAVVWFLHFIYRKTGYIKMKKITCAAIAVLCLDVNGMMDLYNRSDRAIVAKNSYTETIASSVRKPTEDETFDIKEVYRYYGLEAVTQDHVVLSFAKGDEIDGIFWGPHEIIERSYPYTKDFLYLKPAGRSSSYAVSKLSANTEELGIITIAETYWDWNNPLEHQTKVPSEIENDDDFTTERTVQTFVVADGIERTVKIEETSTPYTFEQLRNRVIGFSKNQETVANHVRENGDPVYKDWEELALVLKPASSNPTTASPTPRSQNSSLKLTFGRGNSSKTTPSALTNSADSITSRHGICVESYR